MGKPAHVESAIHSPQSPHCNHHGATSPHSDTLVSATLLLSPASYSCCHPYSVRVCCVRWLRSAFVRLCRVPSLQWSPCGLVCLAALPPSATMLLNSLPSPLARSAHSATCQKSTLAEQPPPLRPSTYRLHSPLPHSVGRHRQYCPLRCRQHGRPSLWTATLRHHSSPSLCSHRLHLLGSDGLPHWLLRAPYDSSYTATAVRDGLHNHALTQRHTRSCCVTRMIPPSTRASR